MSTETQRAELINALLSLLDDQMLGLEEDQEDIIKEAAALLSADSKAGREPVAEIVASRYGGGKPIASMTNCEVAGLSDEEIRAAAKEALFGQGIDHAH